MIDIHCHILPMIDDGASSWDVAKQMCQIAWTDGITHIVATPHANSQFQYDHQAHSARLAQLQIETETKLRFSLGCDFHLSFENLELLFANPGDFLIEGTRYLLIEFSDFALPPRFDHLLFRMRTDLQVVPILTHPERNPLLQRDPKLIPGWVDAGCLVQVTANSLTGDWGRKAKDTALWLLQRRLVHIVASDAHDTQKRPPILSAAREYLANKVGKDVATALVDTNPLTVVENGAASSLLWAPKL